jgi:uncharacterized iron-regulated protein
MLTISSCVKYNDNAWSLLDFVGFCSGTNYKSTILFIQEKALLSPTLSLPFSLFFLLFISWPLFLLCLAAPAAAGIPTYELAIAFQPEKMTMSGTAHISLPADQELSLTFDDLTISGIMLNKIGQEAIPVLIPTNNQLHLPASEEKLEIFISYSKQIPPNGTDNLISTHGITLTSRWHPLPDKDLLYKLTASVPEGFSAIAESDVLIYSKSARQLSFSFSQPLRSMHFVAGPYAIKTLKIRDNLLVSTWFFKEDVSLSKEYLEAARRYIRRYEQEIGPFPYNHYAIIANRLPSGLGMPTFTLLGQQVLRLPFIKETSLGHEILHSWFGNSITIHPDSGNWCEGLTSYLADFTYDEYKGQGASRRKEAIINYLSHVSAQNTITLANFNSADHNQPLARAIRAIGYNKGAMFFHELKGLIGQKAFSEGIRRFYQQYRGQAVSWHEIEAIFAQTSKQDLQTFFQERLNRADIPNLSVSNIQTDTHNDQTLLTFTVEQHSKKPFTLVLPILVRTQQGEQRFSRTLAQATTTIELPVNDLPVELIIDPDHDLLRVLTKNEFPPVWSRFLGSPDKRIVLASESAAKIFAPLLQSPLIDDSWKIMTADQVRNQDLGTSAFLFLGANSPASRSLFATPNHPQQGFTLDVRANPLNRSQVAVLMSSSSAAATAAVIPKLSHYGKYSWMHFQQGKIQEKSIRDSESGLHFIIEQLPSGGSVSMLGSFDTTIDQLNQRRVIYVGENHTSMADHLLQFRIIQALHLKNPDLAIGLEMFPGACQPALDAYINDNTISEQDFLRDSRYFEVWRYDWRFFRPIFNYARKHKIPVIGLNLDREIVSKVFADGHTDNLSANQKAILPENRNLDLQGYTDRLDEIQGMHAQNQQEKKGMLTGFIQSQAIWDETMAEKAANFLTTHPTTRLVVLAGSQHTRKDSGIPPRVASRIKVTQASVLNLSAENNLANLAQTTDFFFLADPVDLEPLGKMGLVLSEKKEGEKGGMKISDISPQGKAAQAEVQKNDVLVAINNTAINSMADVQLALMDKLAGEKVKLHILRQDTKQLTETKEVYLELSNLEAAKPHP